MSTLLETIEITEVTFTKNHELSLTLSNGRTVLVPLDKFKSIAALSEAERRDFEVIDGENLSFLAIDEIYNVHELIGL